MCPAIIFHGDTDVSISLDKAETLRNGLVGCEDLVVVPGGSHASNLTHPNDITDVPHFSTPI
jgi:3-oxoadipate enol-lactonase